jgi:hypothetical protein
MMVGGLLVLGILAIGGRGGSNASRPDSLEANGFQYDIGAPGAFIRVRWDRPRALAQSSILGYVIWRSDPQAFEPQVVGGFFADSNRFFTDNEATRDVTAYDGQPGTNDAGSATTFADVPGIVPGTEYRYYIAAAYQNRLEDTDGDGMPDTGDEHMSPLSSASSWVTAISPAIITAIDNDTDLSSPPDIDLRRVQLEWQQTPGADSYVVWVSPNPNFPSSNRISIGPFRVVPVNQGGNQSITRTINADRGGLSRKRVVYFSIGAWSTSDRTRPKPLGAIFSAAAAAHPIETPPPPPGSGSAEGGKKKGDKDNSRGNGKKP